MYNKHVDIKVRSQLLDKENIELGGGLGRFSGNAWRNDLMGMNATTENAECGANTIAAAVEDY